MVAKTDVVDRNTIYTFWVGLFNPAESAGVTLEASIRVQHKLSTLGGQMTEYIE